MAVDDDPDDPDDDEAAHDAEEAAVETPISLNEQRLDAVRRRVLREQSAHTRRRPRLRRGEAAASAPRASRPGRPSRRRRRVVARARDRGVAVCSSHGCRRASASGVELLQGALTYRDRRLAGFDAAAVVEVIEHLDPPRLAAFERVAVRARAAARPSS